MALAPLFLAALSAALPALQAGGTEWPGALSAAPAPTSAAPPVPVASAGLPDGWQEIAPGAWYGGRHTPGGTLFIGYGGYGADGAGARNWAAAVAAAKGWPMYAAVAGPETVYYDRAEKRPANTRLLTDIIPALAPGRIVVAAHSSGSFVAREMMEILGKLGRKDLLPRMAYYDIDGGPCAACRKYADDASNEGFVFRCVSASQPGGPAAPNIAPMRGCGKYYLELKAEASGCTGAWCLHGWLINREAAALGAVRPPVREYYQSPSLVPCVAYLEGL